MPISLMSLDTYQSGYENPPHTGMGNVVFYFSSSQAVSEKQEGGHSRD